ncbi:ribose-phosphate pyrophosphokinase [Nocardia abscessus]|uniref:ribose-phosphate diphosphokinase n=1 Tax=Nocardia TaxID=1817 RepID=UPI001893B19A|nr:MULTISPECIES: ribose-phosphate pyrophosphokinase [Nocardia]MBF6221980.1 ribose-phosphate pyrophosphokinase [Nocardia abscessus]MDE1674646.1 ribose-phosphate pyrophosphokinase [Nocardia gipuzkoensis]
MTSIRVLSGSADPQLATAIAHLLDVASADCAIERFPDGEVRPIVDRVRDDDVYIVQSTSPPVGDHLVELLLLLDACRRGGAARVTAVVPYFGYARQDRRTRSGQALGVRVVAEAIASAGADRLVVIDPHTPTLEAICPVPVEILTAVPLLSSVVLPARSERTVVVAPDLGAAKLAERYAATVPNSVALVRKFRESGTTVTAVEALGDVAGRQAVIVDDMISTGATIEAAVRLLHHHATDIIVAATHGPLTPDATARLRELGLRRVVVTDSIAHRDSAAPIEVCSVAALLADAIARLHGERPRYELLGQV